MPTTPNLDIAHIETNQSQKEVTANAAFDALDGALAGLLAKTITSTNVTLTDAEALQSAYVRVTGTFTANRTLTVPDNAKFYVVEHAGGGNFTLTVKTAAGTGIALEQDTVQVLYCDAVNVVAATGATGAGGDPYDVGASIPGLPDDGGVILRYPFPRAVSFAEDLPNAQMVAGVAADDTAVFSIRKNGVEFATATVDAAATVATFDAAAATFAAGDILTIIAPSPQDATLADLGIALSGTRI